MKIDQEELTVLITCKHEAVLLLNWLKKTEPRVICTSVNAYLMLHAQGFRGVLELIDAPLPGDTANALVERAEGLARAVDEAVAQFLREQTGLPISQGWDYWDKLLFATSLMPIKQWLDTHDLSGLPDRLTVCQFANAQDYLHPSLIRSELFSDALSRAGKRLLRIPIEFPLMLPHTPGVWRCNYRVSGKYLQGARLIHVPSAFYSQMELVRLYGEEGFLGLQSPFYENPILLRNIELDRENRATRAWPFDMEVPRRIYREFAEAVGLGGLEGLPKQLDHWQERLAFQYRAFKMLALLRDRYGVSLAAISDHDGGLFGPLCSAFKGQKERVRIFPHSTIFVGPMPDLPSEATGVMACIRPLDAFDGARLPPPGFRRGVPRPWAEGGTIAIVLNEIDDVSGLPVHGFRSMLDFVKGLTSGLSAMGLRPVLRARPSTPVRAFCEFDVETSDGDLGELIASSTMCIGVGQVTSALCRFWSAGVDCVQVQERGLCLHDLYTLPAEGVQHFVGRPFNEALPDVLAHVERMAAAARGQ